MNISFHHRELDVTRVALEAMVRCDHIAKSLPRGYGYFADQLQRSSGSAYLNTTESLGRRGADRKNRLRTAQSEANEAVATLDGLMALGLLERKEGDEVSTLLGRVCQMLSGLEKKK
jgi:four helix bundle protein